MQVMQGGGAQQFGQGGLSAGFGGTTPHTNRLIKHCKPSAQLLPAQSKRTQLLCAMATGFLTLCSKADSSAVGGRARVGVGGAGALGGGGRKHTRGPVRFGWVRGRVIGSRRALPTAPRPCRAHCLAGCLGGLRWARCTWLSPAIACTAYQLQGGACRHPALRCPPTPAVALGARRRTPLDRRLVPSSAWLFTECVVHTASWHLCRAWGPFARGRLAPLPAWGCRTARRVLLDLLGIRPPGPLAGASHSLKVADLRTVQAWCSARAASDAGHALHTLRLPAWQAERKLLPVKQAGLWRFQQASNPVTSACKL